MRTAIIGAGSMGVALARHFTRLGHRICIANSKGAHSLSTLAAEIGATPASVAEATRSAQIVVLAIPTKAVGQLARGLFAALSPDSVVIDIGNYHPELRDGRIDEIDRGMLDSQWVAQRIGHPVEEGSRRCAALAF